MRNFTLASLFLLLLLGYAVNPLSAQPIPPNVLVVSEPGLQNEEQVWICPKDTTIFLTNHRDFRLGYRQIGLGRGIFHGLIWIDTLIHPDYQIFTRQSDPVMTTNSDGDIIICHLDYIPIPSNDDSSHIAFMVSEDCGATWNGPYTVSDSIGAYFEDKQFIGCDRTGGPYDGNVYISWTRFPNPTRIMFARSTTGATSFEDTIIVGSVVSPSCTGFTYGAGQFSQPLVGKDGAVYVFWQGVHVDSSEGNCDAYYALRYNKSTDGGVTWEGDRLLRDPPLSGYSFVDGDIDVYSQPTTEADIGNGPHAGNLYVQYRDFNWDSPNLDSDIWSMRSLDTGKTWTEPIRCNDDPLGPDVDQFHNWLIINHEGILASIWYDQRDDPGHLLFHVYAAYSFDGGETWTSNHRISEQQIDPADLLAAKMRIYEQEGFVPPPATKSPNEAQTPRAGLIAEYIGLSIDHDQLVAVWTTTAVAGNQDVMSATWHLFLTDPRTLAPLITDPVTCGSSFVWATAWKESDDAYQLQISDDVNFATVLLDTMLDDNTCDPDFSGWTGGTYFWRVKAFRNTPFEATGFSGPDTFTLVACSGCSCPNQGDIAPMPVTDGVINVLDVVASIDYVFRSGPTPTQDPGCPNRRSDVAPESPACGDGSTNILDVVKLIDHVFRSAPAPCDPCQ